MTSQMERLGLDPEFVRDRKARARAAEYYVARELSGGLRDAYDQIGDVDVYSADGRRVLTIDVKSISAGSSFVNGGTKRPKSLVVVVSWIGVEPDIYGLVEREQWTYARPPAGSGRAHEPCWFVTTEQVNRRYWLVLKTPGRATEVDRTSSPPGALSTDDVTLAEWVGLPETRDPRDPTLRRVVQRRIWRTRKRRQVERSRSAPAPMFFDDQLARGRPRRDLANSSHPGRGSKRRDPDELCRTCRVARRDHRDWADGGTHDFAV